MLRAIFVTDIDQKPALMEALDTLVSGGKAEMSLEPITVMDNGCEVETSLTRIILDYDSSTELPEYKPYIPFQTTITLESGEDWTYTQEREDLDIAIVGSMVGIKSLSIVKKYIKQSMQLSFCIGNEPLWIDPDTWYDLSKSISETEGMKFVSSNPLMRILIGERLIKYATMAAKKGLDENDFPNTIVKHKDVDIWICPKETDISDIESDLATLEDRGIFYVNPSKYSLYTEFSPVHEVIEAYGYEHYDGLRDCVIDSTEKFECLCPSTPVSRPQIASPKGSPKLPISLITSPKSFKDCACTKLNSKGTLRELPKNYENPEADHRIYLIGKDPFNEQFFEQAVEIVLKGEIPFISVSFSSQHFPSYKWKASFTESLMKAMTMKGTSSYCSPKNIYSLEVVGDNDGLDFSETEHLASVIPRTLTVSFMCHSSLMYKTILSGCVNPLKYVCIKVDTMENAIDTRYKLSDKKIRSFLVDMEGQLYVCLNTVQRDEESNPPQLQEISKEFLLQALEDNNNKESLNALRKYILSISNGDYQSVPGSVRNIDNLSLEELTECTTDKNGILYTMNQYLQLDKEQKKKFSSNSNLTIGFNAYGYYTFGPLLGIYDQLACENLSMVYHDGVILYKVFDKNERVLFEVCYSTGLMTPICDLVLNVEKADQVRLQLQKLLEGGELYTPWAQAYISTFDKISYHGVKKSEEIVELLELS